MLVHKNTSIVFQLAAFINAHPLWVLTGALALAVGSLIRPQFFQQLFVSLGKALWRGSKRWLAGVFGRSQNVSSTGLSVGDEWIPDSAWLRHTHIAGSTGTGKTVLEEFLIYSRIAMGYGMLVIDPKGDRELYERIREYCRAIGREKDLHYLSASWPEESVRWNPCSLGNASELQSKWFNSGTYNEPFYAKACELGLLEAFNALLDDRPESFTLADLVRQLKAQTGDSKQSITQGLYLDLQAFAKSEWGEILCMPQGVTGNDRPVVSLLDITSKNQILFVDLPTESKAVQSSRVGKLLLQEMMLVSGLRKLYPQLKSNRPFAVFIDEFDAFATENFTTFLNKGRSSDFMIHIAHQTLSDLDKVSPTFKGQVMGNCNVRFIFRQDDPKDAEEWCKFIGTQKVIKKTYRASSGWQTGETSNRESEEFVVHPNEIKSLKIGECVLSLKTEGLTRKFKLPYPLKAPKPKYTLERETRVERPKTSAPMSKERGLRQFNETTSEQASLLEEARKDKSKIYVKKPSQKQTDDELLAD